MDVRVGHLRFSTPTKSSAMVYVIDGDHITAMPRANAEALYRSLVRNGDQVVIDPPKKSFTSEDNLGGYGTHVAW